MLSVCKYKLGPLIPAVDLVATMVAWHAVVMAHQIEQKGKNANRMRANMYAFLILKIFFPTIFILIRFRDNLDKMGYAVDGSHVYDGVCVSVRVCVKGKRTK